MATRPPARRDGRDASNEHATLTSAEQAAPDDSRRVLLITGNGWLQPHRLDRDKVVIGRAPDCDVVVEHRAMSRRHAILHLGAKVTVQDLGSTNGTRVGREQRSGGEPMRLEEGESFHIGPFSFLLVRASPAAALSTSRSGHGLLRIDNPTFESATPLLRDVAASAATVLIQGETGVGKELLADTVHRLSGRRGPLVRVNCAALSANLIESELFGHEKGAFTGAITAKEGLFEAAQGGSVFLDEIGELPLDLQAKLLRVLEANEATRLGATRPIKIDARYIAATNRDLAAEVAAGRFRSDLYYRLDGITLRIPPLRERRELILPLAMGFLCAGRSSSERAPRLDPDAMAALEQHAWPGNVRELKAVVERAVLLARGGPIGLRHLTLGKAAAVVGPTVTRAPSPPAPEAASDPALLGLSAAELAERAKIIEVLDACAGNQTRAAKALGLSRTTFVTRLGLYRIPRPRPR
jgi:DNA-binding NtrC family response regulator